MKLSKLTAVAFALWPLCAQASGDADIARRFGLIGTWAVDCNQPATANNPYETFAVAPNGTIVQSLDSLSIEPSDHLHGLRLEGDKLSVKWDSATSKTTLDIVLKNDNGKLRSWSSARPDGTVVVRDGKSAKTGNPMSAFEKCVVKKRG